MTPENIIIITVVGISIMLVGFGILAFMIFSMRKSTREDQSLLMLQNQINALNESVEKKLGSSNEMMQKQMHQSMKTITDITEKLSELDNTNKQVINFSEQLKTLQDILRNPKQRGVIGEYYLENVLQNVLPPDNFQVQYSFSDGSMVDAAIFVKDKIIPVDSKFSLENYERMLNASTPDEKSNYEKALKEDIKKRVDETSKYIKPKYDTLDFAFMFIPSEAIFYDILVNKIGSPGADLVEYAFKKKVIIVSPTTFLAYLQTVLQGLRALQIEKSAESIRHNVQKLSVHLQKFDENYNKLGKNLGTVVNTYNSGYTEFKLIDKDIVKITGQDESIEILPVQRPEIED